MLLILKQGDYLENGKGDTMNTAWRVLLFIIVLPLGILTIAVTGVIEKISWAISQMKKQKIQINFTEKIPVNYFSQRMIQK